MLTEAPSSTPGESSAQDLLYQEVLNNYTAAIDRLTRAYELNPEERRDLVQEREPARKPVTTERPPLAAPLDAAQRQLHARADFELVEDMA